MQSQDAVEDLLREANLDISADQFRVLLFVPSLFILGDNCVLQLINLGSKFLSESIVLLDGCTNEVSDFDVRDAIRLG